MVATSSCLGRLAAGEQPWVYGGGCSFLFGREGMLFGVIFKGNLN